MVEKMKEKPEIKSSRTNNVDVKICTVGGNSYTKGKLKRKSGKRTERERERGWGGK